MCHQPCVNAVSDAASNSAFDAFKIWIPLVSSLLGGFLVIAGQILLGNTKRREEEKNELRSIISAFEKKSALLYFSLKDFAYYKLCYSYFTYLFDEHKATKLAEGKTEEVAEADAKFYLDEHIKNQEKIFATELIINNLMSDLVELIGRFERIKPNWANYSTNLEQLKSITFRVPDDYEFDKSKTDYVINSEFLGDQITLMNEYRENIAFLSTIVDEMKSLL